MYSEKTKGIKILFLCVEFVITEHGFIKHGKIMTLEKKYLGREVSFPYEATCEPKFG